MKTSIVVSLIVGIIASLIASYVFNKYIMSESKQNNQVVEACSTNVDNQEQHTN